MTEAIRRKLSDSAAARWIALMIVAVTMMFGYFFTDVMSPLEPLVTASKEAGGLGWSSDDYGFFSGSYGFFNVFLLLLFFGGIILDKFGIRFTGILSTILMFVGALIKWWALDNEFEGTLFGYQMQVIWACLGFAVYGVGCEICGITVSKVIVKWFTGHELAFAMGVQVALARLGTACSFSFSLPFAKAMGAVSAPIGLGAALLCAGVLIYLVYCVMDRKEDKSVAMTLMVVKYGVEETLAGYIPSMLPYGTIFLTPLFGYIYDKVGKGATLMLLGSILLTLVHVIFALPVTSVALAVAVMVMLGVSFGLVPSAMWPSVPKIIPMQLLGTAYALIFYIQNIGLSMVPILIGKVNQANTSADGVIDYTMTMAIFACFGIAAIVVSLLLKAEDRKKGYGLELANAVKS